VPRFVYRYVGAFREHFSFLPADPPSQWLEPGQLLACTGPLEDARFLLQEKSKPKNTSQQPSGSSAQKEA